MTNHHVNSGDCEKCNEILDAYPGFFESMRSWFKALQKKHPETHTSCAGRGRTEQEHCFEIRTSKAHYGQSSHNFNAALDLFELQGDPKNLWEISWFREVVGPAVSAASAEFGIEIEWYGRPHAPFYELPHCEVKTWRDMVKKGLLKPVE